MGSYEISASTREDLMWSLENLWYQYKAQDSICHFVDDYR